MKKSRIIYVLLALIIIAGAICAYTMKFNFSLAYDDSVRIDISIGKEYKVEDMNQIAKEVFQDQEFIVQDVEIFNDMAAITVRTVTDEQKNQLVQKERIQEDLAKQNTSKVTLETEIVQLTDKISQLETERKLAAGLSDDQVETLRSEMIQFYQSEASAKNEVNQLEQQIEQNWRQFFA